MLNRLFAPIFAFSSNDALAIETLTDHCETLPAYFTRNKLSNSPIRMSVASSVCERQGFKDSLICAIFYRTACSEFAIFRLTFAHLNNRQSSSNFCCAFLSKGPFQQFNPLVSRSLQSQSAGPLRQPVFRITQTLFRDLLAPCYS